MTQSVHQRIAEELGVAERQVRAAVDLLDGGATVPFIARYRKEATGAARRRAAAHARGAAALPARAGGAARRGPGVDRGQGKLDDALEAQILAADTKARLEDIYLPYKPKRRTKAQIAREAGLEPLADRLLADPTPGPAAARGRASSTPTAGVADAARRAGRRPRHPGRALRRGRRPGRRRCASSCGRGAGLVARVREGKEAGRREVRRLLRLRRAVPEAALAPDAGHVAGREGGRAGADHGPGVRRRRRRGHRAQPVRGRRGRAGSASPTGGGPPTGGCSTRCAGPGVPGSSSISARTCGCGCGRRPRTRPSGCSPPTCATCCSPPPPAAAPTMGLDPGFRTGVKVAVVDATGKVVATDTIYPHEPRRQWDESLRHAGDAGRGARRRADRDRQRHRLAARPTSSPAS